MEADALFQSLPSPPLEAERLAYFDLRLGDHVGAFPVLHLVIVDRAMREAMRVCVELGRWDLIGGKHEILAYQSGVNHR